MLHLPMLHSINGNDLEEDRDLFQEMSIPWTKRENPGKTQ
jgi:hypothetical protein